MKHQGCQQRYIIRTRRIEMVAKGFVDHGVEIFFFKILFIYSSERKREAKGEAGFPRSKEPDAGLDPRTP